MSAARKPRLTAPDPLSLGSDGVATHPALIVERSRMLAARSASAANGTRYPAYAPVCNSTSTQPYTGTELAPFTSRASAMRAFDLPTRVGQRLHHRDGRVTDLQGNAIAEPAPAPAPAPVARTAPAAAGCKPVAPAARVPGGRPPGHTGYYPAPESYAGQALTHLAAHRGPLMRTQMTKLFGMPPASFVNCFAMAFQHGLLLRVTRGRAVGVALPKGAVRMGKGEAA